MKYVLLLLTFSIFSQAGIGQTETQNQVMNSLMPVVAPSHSRGPATNVDIGGDPNNLMYRGGGVEGGFNNINQFTTYSLRGTRHTIFIPHSAVAPTPVSSGNDGTGE